MEEVNQLEGFTTQEVDCAKRAKKLYYDLDAPTLGDLKMWVRSNQAKNVSVSVEDIKLLEKMEEKTYQQSKER